MAQTCNLDMKIDRAQCTSLVVAIGLNLRLHNVKSYCVF
jgi:hypothetical protein